MEVPGGFEGEGGWTGGDDGVGVAAVDGADVADGKPVPAVDVRHPRRASVVVSPNVGGRRGEDTWR